MTYKETVVFHKFPCWDSDLIVWGLGYLPGLDINLVGQSMEKYLRMRWGDHIVVKDRLESPASTLQTLTSDLLMSGKALCKQLGSSI